MRTKLRTLEPRAALHSHVHEQMYKVNNAHTH